MSQNDEILLKNQINLEGFFFNLHFRFKKQEAHCGFWKKDVAILSLSAVSHFYFSF